MKLCYMTRGMIAGLLVIGIFVAPSWAQERLQVVVSILPQEYLAKKIGADWVDVSVMVEPGVDPHVYDPRPQQMVALTKAKVYFAIGVPFEDVWLDRFQATNPAMKIVHTEAGIERLAMAEHDHHHDGSQAREAPHEGAEGEKEHVHEGTDPHVWLSPPLAMLLARNILTGLQEADPAHSAAYQVNYKKLIQEIVELDQHLMNVFLDKGQADEFMVFHPAWGYFAAAYGLKQMPVEVEGKEPKAADLKRLIQYAKEHKIRVIFVQPQFSTTSAKVIADAIGARIVFADPMSSDWERNLREVGDKFREALR